MADKHQDFVCSYLRLNGYFTIPNFIIHAADDTKRVVSGTVGNYTEIDLMGIRMPYSVEQTAHLKIANDPLLVAGAEGKFDVVIGEVKGGATNKPNAAWRPGAHAHPLEDLVRFMGLLPSEAEIKRNADILSRTYRCETNRCRMRYLIFAEKPNAHYRSLGVQYITFREIARFLVDVRGQCWLDSGLGVASSHPQWDPLLLKVFHVANDCSLPIDERTDRVIDALSES